MGNQAGSRFGQDGPNRITVAPSMLTEASEVMPYEPVYYPVIPFLPPSISNGGGSGSGGSGGGVGASILTGVSEEDYKMYPGHLDLHWWQGDDVVIRLNISDASDPNLDLSIDNGCVWTGQVRVLHDKHATRAYDFSISTAYTAPDPDIEDALGVTQVSLFLHRDFNRYRGVYHWDLQCRIPTDLSEFPKPEGTGNMVWPPTDAVKTYLYGLVYVVPEVSTEVPPSTGVAEPIRIIWPNGMVP